jgi:hypothetical protein|tara:strand:+ start:429 stop:530 length:102 start_codon:yes stop_codon:yes gene_type:complete
MKVKSSVLDGNREGKEKLKLNDIKIKEFISNIT